MLAPEDQPARPSSVAASDAAFFEGRLAERETLSGGYVRLVFAYAEGPDLRAVAPGRFVMVRGPWEEDPTGPRAFSILDAPASDRLEILLKVYGRGTRRLAAMPVGAPVTMTAPLGRGFDPTTADGPRRLLVAGGVGLPPLHLLARRAAAAGLSARIEFFYGGRNADDLVLVEPLCEAGIGVVLATEDGSRGVPGRVTVPLADRLARAARAGEAVEVCACGPEGMLRAVRSLALETGVPTQLCLEANMACGFGACLGCAVPVYGPRPYRYCCTDGPVFDAREVRW
ncbi:MAG: dihydroorotate dehydrogenase electron transfer subunit [Deltaproteobacteria bacterium]|nr:MAG: dihydroorotate dehydrogenase electron transfer subunit [Deltaproteobacteria bacterium]